MSVKSVNCAELPSTGTLCALSWIFLDRYIWNTWATDEGTDQNLGSVKCPRRFCDEAMSRLYALIASLRTQTHTDGVYLAFESHDRRQSKGLDFLLRLSNLNGSG